MRWAPFRTTGAGERPAPDLSDLGPPFERNTPYAPTTDNRPVPLQRGRLAFTRDPGWQMSFGERAAFEGVLAQLRPALRDRIDTFSARRPGVTNPPRSRPPTRMVAFTSCAPAIFTLRCVAATSASMGAAATPTTT